MKGSSDIGVVVIGRNERAHLEGCIAALGEYRKRLIYADSASTDGSAELAATLGAVVVRLSTDRPLTPSRGRKVGFEELRKRWPNCHFVQFVDGDSDVSPGWIEAGADFLRHSDRAAVVAGNCIEAFPEASFYNWMCSEEWGRELGRDAPYGGNAMMRVSALETVGLFRTDMKAGEEAELAGRLRAGGWETWRIDRPMVRHDAAIVSFGQWWTRAVRGGFGYASAWVATRRRPSPLYSSQLRSALFWVLGLPFTIVVLSATLGIPLLLVAVPVAYALQIAKLAARREPTSLRSWRYSAMLMLAKVAEVVGVVDYLFSSHRLSRSTVLPDQRPARDL